MIRTCAGALALALTIAVCQAADPDRPGPAQAADDRQILVMLRMAPPHFRPDASY
jgi:hypothetical protein